jgi:hypothetical protein
MRLAAEALLAGKIDFCTAPAAGRVRDPTYSAGRQN